MLEPIESSTERVNKIIFRGRNLKETAIGSNLLYLKYKTAFIY
jgi:hypothetical protein